ncbi:MAG TPA: AI-2E family transporter [Steroidobacteraceae bacterium]|nr:AI-2E family transporter [Steroidobacteraceae bacterium]
MNQPQPPSEQTDSRTLRRWFAVGSVLVVLWAVWVILKPMRMPIAWAAVLAFLLYPLQQRLTRALGGRRAAAAGILTGLTPVAIFVPLTLIGIAFAQQVAGIAAALQHNPVLFDLSRWLDPAEHPRIAQLAEWAARRFGLRLSELPQYLRAGAQEWAGTLARSSGALFLNTAGALLRFFLMLFVLFFVLRDGSLWFARIAALLPLSEEKSDALFTRLGRVLRAVVYGCGLTALVQGALVAIGFAIAGLSGPIVFGVLACVMALLPFGGAAVIWFPGVLYLLATGSIGWAIFLLAWGAVVSISDNFIRPVIISRYTPVPTLLVFLGVIGGVSAFGPIGFILGPVILVLAIELLRYTEGSIGK